MKKKPSCLRQGMWQTLLIKKRADGTIPPTTSDFNRKIKIEGNNEITGNSKQI